MTQTKTYIDLKELKALRFECKECRAVLILPFEPHLAKGVRDCPKCHTAWTVVNNTAFDSEIDALVNSVVDLLPHLKTMGFDLKLELGSAGS